MSQDSQSLEKRKLFVLPAIDGGVNSVQTYKGDSFVSRIKCSGIPYQELMDSKPQNTSWCEREANRAKRSVIPEQNRDSVDWSGSTRRELEDQFSSELNKNGRMLEHMGAGGRSTGGFGLY